MSEVIDTEEFGMMSLIVFLSSLAVNLVIFIYALFHNFVFLRIHSVAEGISIIPTFLLTIMENFITWFEIIPTSVDKFWFISFVIFVILLIRSSYFARRMSNFSFISFLNFFIYFFLFAMGIAVELGKWFNNLIINEVLLGFSVLTPLFTGYLNNCFLINLVIVLICVLVNRVDLDLVKDFSRKLKEQALNQQLDDVDKTEEL